VSIAFLICTGAPVLYVIVWAWFGTDVIGVLSPRPTARWYATVLGQDQWRNALAYSWIVALLVALAGTVLALLHCYSSRFRARQGKVSTQALILLPLVIPGVIYGLALLLGAGRVGLAEHETTLLAIGHLMTIVPAQYFIFEAQQESFRSETLFGAVSLGASPWRSLFVVYMPNVVRPLSYAFLTGFFLSFDETVIALFVLNKPQVTIPRQMWDQVDQITQPIPAVVASLLLLVVIIAVVLSLAWPSVSRIVDTEVGRLEE
jgi:ABC-type spermidine/putrescine transport system permease subunit II